MIINPAWLALGPEANISFCLGERSFDTVNVNPQYVSAPFECAYVTWVQPPPKHWSRKRRLKAARRMHKAKNKSFMRMLDQCKTFRPEDYA